MIRLQEIQNALMSVVGWEQGYGDTTLAKTIIEPDITESESGLTFQGAHPLVTLDNVKSIMPANYSEKYLDVTDSSGIFYRGDKVRSNGNYYVCIEDGSANPQDAPEGWVSWNPLNDFLMDLMKRAINTAVQTFIQTKQLNEETKNLLERRTFFDGAARLQAMIDPRGKIVWFTASAALECIFSILRNSSRFKLRILITLIHPAASNGLRHRNRCIFLISATAMMPGARGFFAIIKTTFQMGCAL